MTINYPVDVANTRWAVYRVSTGEIIVRNQVWPVADGGPIPGLDPDYVYLLHVNATQPDHDARLYRLIASETPDLESSELRLTWTTERRDDDERVQAAHNEESKRLADIVLLEREVLETRLMVGAILTHLIDNQQFPQKVRDMANKYISKANRVWRNRDRFQEIVGEIQAGQDPDMDSGWDTGE